MTEPHFLFDCYVGVGSAFTLFPLDTHVKPILHINIEDVQVTRQLVEAGKLLSIDVLDHLVIGQGGRWLSLKERGFGL